MKNALLQASFFAGAQIPSVKTLNPSGATEGAQNLLRGASPWEAFKASLYFDSQRHSDWHQSN